MSTLYEISENLTSLVNEETGEIADFEQFEALQMQLEDKIEGIALWHINLISDAKQYAEEKAKFEKREKACKAKAESLKRYLEAFLHGEKFKTPKVNVTYRKSESVIVDDALDIPLRFLKEVEPEVDKTAVKEALKRGEIVQGAHLEEKQNIQIK